MPLNADRVAEIRLLTQFNLHSLQEGIKVHHDADHELVEAAKRLFDKGLISQADGGYLTHLGIEAAEHAEHLLTILKAD